jgi:hypothetical protein
MKYNFQMDSNGIMFVQNFIKISQLVQKFHVRWVSCHHSMACPRVAGGGNGLQIWRVAVNILNKQSQTDDKGWSSSLGVWSGAFELTVKNNLVTKIHKKPQTWTDSLDNRPKRRKMDLRFGKWNVRSMYRAGSLLRS